MNPNFPVLASRHVLLTALTCSALSCLASAVPLEEAKVHKVIKDVWVVDTARGGSRTAALEEVIKGSLAVRTGVMSRAELLFQDETLTRLGAESFFKFTPGTRDMTLDKGTMLLQVPKGHGGAKISTAAVTAAITGTTIMLENRPGKRIKVLVLEGSLRLSNNHGGDHVTLTPGKMIIMSPADKRLPKPVDVDLQKIVRTSSLVDPAKFQGSSKTKVAPLPSLPLIQRAVDVQATLIRSGRLTETKLVINGNGSDVVVAPAPVVDASRDRPETAGTDLATASKRERATAPVVPASGSGGKAAPGDRAPVAVNSTSLKLAANDRKNGVDSGGSGNQGSGNAQNSGKGDGKGNDNKGQGGNDGNGNGNGNGNNGKDDNKDKGKDNSGKGKGKGKD